MNNEIELSKAKNALNESFNALLRLLSGRPIDFVIIVWQFNVIESQVKKERLKWNWLKFKWQFDYIWILVD